MPTTADILIDTLIAWKVEVVFGLPGDGINGIMEALRTRQEKIAFVQVRHEEFGRLHGDGLRQVDRQARRLPRHLRAGRHPPSDRALRCQARPGAGARDHRPAVPRPDRDLHPAGRRPDAGLQRRRRLQRPGHRRRAHGEHGEPRLPLGAVEARRRPPVDRQRHPGAVARRMRRARSATSRSTSRTSGSKAAGSRATKSSTLPPRS